MRRRELPLRACFQSAAPVVAVSEDADDTDEEGGDLSGDDDPAIRATKEASFGTLVSDV